jgi:hypothetical protein
VTETATTPRANNRPAVTETTATRPPSASAAEQRGAVALHAPQIRVLSLTPPLAIRSDRTSNSRRRRPDSRRSGHHSRRITCPQVGVRARRLGAAPPAGSGSANRPAKARGVAVEVWSGVALLGLGLLLLGLAAGSPRRARIWRPVTR